MVDKVALNRLNDTFRLAVNENFLDGLEGLVDPAWIIDVDIVVEVLDEHVRQSRVLVRRPIHQKHARLHKHYTVRLLPILEQEKVQG